MMVVWFGILFLMSIQPVLMVVGLIIITLMYSFLLYKVMGGYWYSYVLVLVVLSGVMVVFMYMVSLIPNEGFEIYNLVFIMVFVMFLFEWSSLLYYDDLSYVSLNLWLLYIGVFNLFLVFFLFAVMVMVVWLSFLHGEAVRIV